MSNYSDQIRNNEGMMEDLMDNYISSEENKSQKEIADFISHMYGFKKFYPSLSEPDYNKFSHVLRVHELHYLYYSCDFKHFTIGVLNESMKGKAGGGFDSVQTIMLPKVINTVPEAKALIEGIVNLKTLRLYN